VMRLYIEMPMITCPACGKEFQWDDYLGVRAESTHDCPHCAEKITVIRAANTCYSLRHPGEPCWIADDGKCAVKSAAGK
jgi:endogenous inhibitor of DNA gyrase (YacG/DUF329 family)